MYYSTGVLIDFRQNIKNHWLPNIIARSFTKTLAEYSSQPLITFVWVSNEGKIWPKLNIYHVLYYRGHNWFLANTKKPLATYYNARSFTETLAEYSSLPLVTFGWVLDESKYLTKIKYIPCTMVQGSWIDFRLPNTNATSLTETLAEYSSLPLVGWVSDEGKIWQKLSIYHVL